MNEERKLSKAEQKRKEEFDILCDKLVKDGYIKHDITISVKDANTKAILYTMPLIVPLIIVFILMHGYWTMFSYKEFSIAMIINLILIVVHELIHGITWSRFTEKGWDAISFGVIWKMLTPYCTCNEALTKKHYIIGALMPLVVLGLIPAIAALITGSSVLLWIGILMIIGAGGDIYMSLLLWKFEDNGQETIFMDHPCEVGSVAFTK